MKPYKHENTNRRRMVKNTDYFVDEQKEVRLNKEKYYNMYKNINKYTKLKTNYNGLQTARVIFNIIYQLKPSIRELVDKRKKEILKIGNIEHNEPFLAVHLRFGDKVGLLDKSAKEAHVAYDLTYFTRTLLCSYDYEYNKLNITNSRFMPKNIFVATDTYKVFIEFKKLLSPKFNIFTSATSKDIGFSIKKFYTESIRDKEKLKNNYSIWKNIDNSINL